MSELKPVLLPIPREINLTEEFVALAEESLIVIPNAELLFEAQTAQKGLVDYAGVHWQIVAGQDYPNTGLNLEIDSSIGHAEGYHMTIKDGRVTIHGADAAGVFYGVCTLNQLLLQYQNMLPALTIEDWPDYAARGVMLDISRDKVPTLQTTLELVDRLASWKINQVQLYMEHTFAYQHHPLVWAENSPFTGQDVLELDAFCKQRHIELVPNQNSLGHMERWLKFEPYAPLAEKPEGFTSPWDGKHRDASSLNPIDPGSIELMASLYDELLPHFTSTLLNVGGDEPWELGMGKSKPEVEKLGEGRVYLTYLLKLYEQVSARNHTMMFWDDIIIKYPELIPELPKDVIAMVWGYEADHPFDERGAAFDGSGIPFYVCPGTSSWNTFAGRTENTIGNLQNAASNGLKHGAIGFLNTDWGDVGHWQPLPVSYLGFAYGAAVSWALDANAEIDLPPVLDAFAFDDSAHVMGKLAYDLGNVYRVPGHSRRNGHFLIDLLKAPEEDLERWQERYHEYGGEDAESFRVAVEKVNEIMDVLPDANIQRDDADLILSEFELAADLIRHSCYRGMMLFDEAEKSPAEMKQELEQLIERYKENWLARNRPGGLKDSLKRFEPALDAYRQA
ncbi:MAG: family 20 glycosylhydrolase [Anaerolineae bacterium]|nr:family 20 glycosylhydrolase [Anaerolineae bacterium]